MFARPHYMRSAALRTLVQPYATAQMAQASRYCGLLHVSRDFSNSAARHVTTSTITSTNTSRETLKPLDSRKTYLIDDYTRLIRENSMILVLHYGGLLKSENQEIRAQIKKAGGRLIVTRSALFKVALRGLESEDPASRAAHKLYSGKKHPLSPYFSGPSAVIAVKDIDPATVKNIVKVLDSTGDRLILLGALVNGDVMDRRAVDSFKELPTLDQLRADLAGVLTILGGAGLVQTLEASSKVLYLTMESRKKDMEEEK